MKAPKIDVCISCRVSADVLFFVDIDSVRMVDEESCHICDWTLLPTPPILASSLHLELAFWLLAANILSMNQMELDSNAETDFGPRLPQDAIERVTLVCTSQQTERMWSDYLKSQEARKEGLFAGLTGGLASGKPLQLKQGSEC
jgi:hypothetical protein